MQIGYSLGIDVNGTFNGEILYQMGKNILIDKQIQSLFFREINSLHEYSLFNSMQKFHEINRPQITLH